MDQLRSALGECVDIEAAASVLYWDQATHMPEGGAPARGRQLSTLSKIAHEKITNPKMESLLIEAENQCNDFPEDSFEHSFLRVARRNFERAIQVPGSYVKRASQLRCELYDVWTRARPDNDFKRVSSLLKENVALSVEYSSFFKGHAHVADPLIDHADEGMTAEMIKTLFSSLRPSLVNLVKEITDEKPFDDACLRQNFPLQAQWSFGEKIIRKLGYDFSRGRQDKTHHPFMTSFSIGDVRITTRFKEDDLSEGLFSTIHEAGHALYEQGINPEYEGTYLAAGVSAGVHESQSRLWENLVGRSRSFWVYFFPILKEAFPDRFRNLTLDEFYKAINRVEKTLIRTDADEVTYNLHVMLRFDFEMQMLEGKLAVEDLPEAWRERIKSDFGLIVSDDKDGVLQDVHWFSGPVGGVFQGYTIGNVLAAEIFEKVTQAIPDLQDQIAVGNFEGLLNWLTQNVYRHGSKMPAEQLIRNITSGKGLSSKPFLNYIESKYRTLLR